MEPKPSLYVVDDEPAYLEMIQDELEELGVTVTCFESGKALFHALEKPEEYPTAILVDFVLTPSMPGWEVLRKLQKDYPRIPVVIYTGRDRQGTVAAFGNAGYAGYATLVKPVDPGELKDIVQEIFSQKEIFRKMAADVLSITGFDCVLIWQMDKASYTYSIVGGAGAFDRKYRQEVTFHHDEVAWMEKLRNGRLYYCKNVQDERTLPYYQKREEAVARGWHSLITVPLVRGEKVLGWIDAYSTQVDAIAEPHDLQRLREYLEKFAAQASETLRSDALTRQLRMMQEITQKLTWTATEKELFDVILKKAQEYTGAQSGRIYKLDIIQQKLTLGAEIKTADEPPAPKEKKIGEKLTGRVAKEGKYEYMKTPLSEPPMRNNTRSYIAVPIKRGERQVLGVITMKSSYFDFFSADDIQLLQALSASAAVIIDQVKLTNHLQAISTMAQEGDSKSEVKLIQYVVEAARDLTHADVNYWAMSELEGEGDNWLRIKAYSGDFKPEFLAGAKLPTAAGSCSSANALHQKRTITIENVNQLQEGELFYQKDKIAIHQWQSFMAVPLLSKTGDHLGVLGLYSRELKAFLPEGNTLIEHFVRQTALALQEQRHLIALQKLSQIGSELSTGSLGMKALLSRVAELGRRISKADLTVLYPYNYNYREVFDVDSIAYSGELRTEVEFKNIIPKPDGMAFLARTYGAVIVQDVTKPDDPIYIGLDGKSRSNTQAKVIQAHDRQTVVKGITQSNFIRDEGIGAFISVSLRGIGAEGEDSSPELGVMYFNYRSPQVFSEEELRVIEIFSRNTANIIYRNHLHEQAQRQRAQMESINRASITILEQQEQREQFIQIISEAVKLLQAKGGKMYRVINGKRQDARLEAGVNLPAGVKEGDAFSKEEGMVGKVVETRKPLIVNDYRNYPRRIQRYAEHFSAVVEVPLLYQDEVIGVLSVFDDNEKRVFLKEDIYLLETLAAQASLAMYNLQLNRELEALYEAGLQLSEQLDSQKTAASILNELKKIIGFDQATLQLIPGEHLQREIMAIQGFDKPELDPHLLRPINVDDFLKPIVNSKEIKIIEDTHEIESWSKDIYDTTDVRSWAFIPLLYQDRVFGLITLDHREVGYYQAKDAARLKRLGNQAAIAMQNALLFEENQKQKDVQEQAIRNITRSITSFSNDQELYKQVARTAMTLFNDAHRTEIYLQEGDHFSRVAIENKGQIIPQDDRNNFPFDYGLVGEVFRSGESQLLHDVKASSTYALVLRETCSEIAVPIKQGEKVMGVLNIEHPAIGGLTEKDKVIAESLANLAAIVKEKGDLQKGLQLMENFLASAQKITQLRKEEDSMADIMHVLASYAYQINVAKISACVFYLMDKDSFTAIENNPKLTQLAMEVRISYYARGEGLAGWVTQNGEALLINDTQSNEITADKIPALSMILSPIWSGGQIVGVMALESLEKNAFTIQDLQVLEALALLAESSIYNAEQVLKRKVAILRKFNPYQVGSPVYKPEEFYGRQAILAEILSSLHHNHYFIKGERRIGKTSLLLHLKHQLEKLNDAEYAFYPVFYDLQGITSADFYTEFMRRIIQNLDLIDAIDLPQRGEAYDHFQFQDDLDRALSSLEERSNGKTLRMIALMDEIQKLDDLDALIPEQLRRILLNEERIKVVMAGVKFFKQEKSKVSPFNIHISLNLKGFEKLDARELILKPVETVYNYQEEVIHMILGNSKLRPMKIQELCQKAIHHMLKRIEKDSTVKPIILLEDLV